MPKLSVSGNVYFYTFIDSSVSMGITFLVPLYLVSLGISLSKIGFVLALTPLAFAFFRLFLAEIADKKGTYPIVKLGAFLRGISALAYLLPMNFTVAAIANVFSGFSGSPIWTVNRKILYENDLQVQSGKKASILKNVREGADSISKVFFASIAQLFGFFAGFLSIFAVATLLAFPVKGLSSLKDRKDSAGKSRQYNLNPGKVLGTLNLRKYGSFFSRTSIAGVLCLASDGMIFSFAAVIFLSEIVGLSYLETGLYLSLFSAVSFSSLFVLLRQRAVPQISPITKAIYAFFLVFAFFALYISPTREGALVFVILLGISDGVRALYVEEVVAKAVSTDIFAKMYPAKAIAVMGFWSQAGKSVAVFFAGIVAELFGFGAVFLSIVATHLMYVWINGRLLSEKVNQNSDTQKA